MRPLSAVPSEAQSDDCLSDRTAGSLRDDERGQSVQIGAVLLFAVLVLSFSTYQAAVVPDQNRAVEISHSERVQGQLQELRNALVSTVGGGSQRSTAVALGTRYPSRAVAVNPPPPAGTLRTAGTDDALVNVSVRNAVADGEAGDVWNGTARAYPTGGVVYDPGYNVYRDAPRTVYEQTVLYNDYGEARIGLANQTLIEDETVSLVALDGSLSRTSSGTASVDVRPISASERTVAVADDGDPITVAFATRLPAAAWERRLAGQEHVADVRERPDAAPDPYRLVEVVLERGVTYRLQLTKVGVGTGATGENATYLVDRTGGATVRRGETVEVAVAARDDYGNPVQGTTVHGSVGAGTLSPSTATTGDDGRVAFEYDASGVEPGTYEVNLSLGRVGNGFDGGTGENATVEVTVTEPSGPDAAGSYALDWRDPGETDGNGGAALSDCSAESCVWDVGASDGDALALAAALDPPFEGVGVEYAVDDATVGTVAPETGSTGSGGENRTTLTARENGTVDVLASANEDGDVLTVEVTNVTGASGGSGASGSRTTLVEGSGEAFWSGEGVAFDVRNGGPGDVSIVAVTVNGTTRSQAARVAESNGGETERGQHEVYVAASTEGVLDVDGQPYYEDAGTPLAFGTRTAMTEDATVAGGSTATVTLYAFRDNGGNALDMSGSDVTVTLHFADGSAGTYVVSVP
ncbi:Ig-like domain-containing protein [Halomicrobium salinisoli]|uniref:Ig-like domain-containing protein n=1 Tax=Halomicrobium salinisoli TaxID=2878391 RepID=UPI001CEFEB1B|nr:Ig-like domain-containing protein [Halomicrobium salinisoli]